MRSFIFLAVALPFAQALKVSTTGSCGKQVGLTCKGSTFGSCCSQYGYCGSSSSYCGSGCQSAYGTCGTSETPAGPIKVSKDGTCGGKNGFSCLTSQFGNCCSQYGYCGSTQSYCSSGCNSKFGTCWGPGYGTPSSSTRRASSSAHASTTSTRTSSVAAPSSMLKVSKNARCGKGFEGYTCAGSRYGNCCSQYSYCGSTEVYCGKGCQAGFGTCHNSQQSSSKLPVSTSSSAHSSSKSSSSTSTTAGPSETLPPNVSKTSTSNASDISTSGTSASSTSEATSSSTSEATSLSTSEASTVESSEPSITATSTLASSTTDAPSSTSECVPNVPVQTNVVPDGGFENSLRTSIWKSTTTGSYRSAPRVAGGAAAHSGNAHFYGSEVGDIIAAASVDVYQDNILIPSGTLVECSAWFAVVDNRDQTIHLEILIDGQGCGETTVTVPKQNYYEPYVQVKSQLAVTGDTHTVTIRMSHSAGTGAVQYRVDDISVITIAGPPCPVSSSTSLEPSADPTSSSELPSSSTTESASITSSSVKDPSTTVESSATITSSSATDSSTTIAESSTSASSTQACFAAPTNYVTNGDFESGNTNGFTVNSLVSTFSLSNEGPYSGSWSGRGFNLRPDAQSWTNIKQERLSIPAGTTVKASFMARSLRSDAAGALRFRIFVDNWNIGYLAPVKSDGWVQVGGIISRAFIGDTHTMLVTVENDAGAHGPAFEIDNISISAISGPGGIPLCAPPSPSSSVVTSTATAIESSSATIKVTSTSVEASSTPIETSSSAAPPSACTPTNYLGQPDFENADASNLSPWGLGTSGQWDTPKVKKTSDADAVHEGLYAFNAVTSGTGQADLFFDQDNIRIPDGTRAVASFFVKILRPAENVVGSVTLTLSVRSRTTNTEQQLLKVTPNPDRGEYNRWIQLMSEPFTVVGDRQQFRLTVNTNGYKGRVLALDDFELVSICPEGQ